MSNAAQDKVGSDAGSSAGSTGQGTMATISRKTAAKMDQLHNEAKRFCGRDIDVESAMTLRGKKVLTEGVPHKTRKHTVITRATARDSADATATADDTPSSQLHPASAQPPTPPAPLDPPQHAASPVLPNSANPDLHSTTNQQDAGSSPEASDLEDNEDAVDNEMDDEEANADNGGDSYSYDDEDEF